VSFGYRSHESTVSGVNASFQMIRNMLLQSGRFFSEDDFHARRRVAVIGATLSSQLFGNAPAVGNDVKINAVRFRVIGVLKKKVQISNYATPDDISVFVPLSSLAELVDSRYLSDIVVLPVAGSPRNRVIADIRSALARVHNFNAADERAVTITDWN